MSIPVEPEIKYVSKLSIAMIGCKPKRASDSNAPVDLCHIYGNENKVGQYIDKLKDETHAVLLGDFEAENLETGVLIRSAKLFLPQGIQSVVEQAIESSRPVDKDGKPTGEAGMVTFAFLIRSVPPKNPQGYSYEAVSLIRPTEVDPLVQMRKLVVKRKHEQLAASTAPSEEAPVKQKKAS